ncbi:hypothetical protein RFI_26224 [Reticulomyxa filosa]|uniref:GPI-anchor transamidase n=1 Tax=Reticulomyxa filosa TaxID=46433 RepID=X6MAW2_RETFI|nr:hypothetical protein RFI_26224 [Reticulomyxa filosa]|eukprot:ETO11153.1 hypothetical protein RFI_26224 [Reticulomyxa filosa]
MSLKYILTICISFSFCIIHCNSGTTSKHDNNWAVLVCRLNLAQKKNKIFLNKKKDRLAPHDIDDIACNDRNVLKASIIGSKKTTKNTMLSVYDEDVEVDYRGLECNAENLLRVLTHRHFDATPNSKKLNTDSRSNILVYLDGHGGNTFLKFHDKDEIQSQDLADAFNIMHSQVFFFSCRIFPFFGRYNEILFIVDTCQAATLYSHFTAPNIIAIGSSLKGESAYSVCLVLCLSFFFFIKKMRIILFVFWNECCHVIMIHSAA